MYINKQNKRNLKTNIFTFDEFFDIEKLIAKEPQLYSELCEKYPLKKECIYIIQYAHPDVKENVSKTLEASQETPSEVVESQPEIVDGEDYSQFNDVVENPAVIIPPIEEVVDAPAEVKEEFPDDFKPLFNVGEKIKIAYRHGRVVENVEIIDVELSEDKRNYYYSYKVQETGEVKKMGEQFLIDHEIQ